MEQAYGNATRRPDLGVMAFEYMEDAGAQGFIWQELFPVVPTPFKEMTFGVIPIESLLKSYETARAPKGTYNTADYKTEAGKFSCSERGWVEFVDDTEREFYDSLTPGLAEKMAVMRGNGIIMRREEIRCSALMATLSATTVSVCWDVPTTATPIADILAAKKTYRLKCGLAPNLLVLPWVQFENIKATAEVVDRVKYTFPGLEIANATPQQIAMCLGVPRIVIAGSLYDSAGENVDTTIAEIWSNDRCYLTRVPTNPMNLEEPCLGHTFLWVADSAQIPVVEQYRVEDRRSDAYRCRMHMDMKPLQSESDAGAAVSEIYKNVTVALDGLST